MSKWVTVWLLLFMAFNLVGPRLWLKYYRLSRRGAVIPGIVVAEKPHMQVEYSFEVNGRSHDGIGGRSGIGGFSIGDKVLVHYLPDAPETNCLGNPQALFKHELLLELVTDSTFSTMILVALIVRKRRIAHQKSGV